METQQLGMVGVGPRLLGVALVLGVFEPCLATGAELTPELRIDRVTVYADGALVVRRGMVEIPAGEHRLVVRGLPSSLDPDAVRVSVGASAVRLGEVELKKITQADYVSESERVLRKQLEGLQDQRTEIADEVATAETQLKLLDSLASAPTGSASRSGVDATNLSAVLATVSSSGAIARARIREASVHKRALDAQIETVQSELKKIATSRKASYELHAVLEAPSAVSVPVMVGYRMGDANWHFLYEARLDTAHQHVDLVRQAVVEQGSGEDWSNVALTLTTAQPTADLATPGLHPLFVNVAPPPRAEYLAKSTAAAAPASAALEEVMVTGSRRTAADVDATEYLAEYEIPGRVTLLANREPHLYGIGEDAFAVDLVARTVPSVSRSAFLEATFKFERDVPWNAAEMQLYRDGAFVGTTRTSPLLPGADIRLPFGVDERIRIEAHDEQAQSGVRGLFSGLMVEEHRRDYEVTSFHGGPIALELIDRVPVSQNATVKVEFLKGATPATTHDLDGKAGVLLWKLDLKPRERTVVKQYYSVGYPKGEMLEQTEGEAGT